MILGVFGLAEFFDWVNVQLVEPPLNPGLILIELDSLDAERATGDGCSLSPIDFSSTIQLPIQFE